MTGISYPKSRSFINSSKRMTATLGKGISASMRKCASSLTM